MASFLSSRIRERSSLVLAGGGLVLLLCCSLPPRGLYHPISLALSSSALMPLLRSMTYLSILSVADGDAPSSLPSRARCRKFTQSVSRRLRRSLRSPDADPSEAGGASRCCDDSSWLWPSTRNMSGCVSGCDWRSSAKIRSSSPSCGALALAPALAVVASSEGAQS